MFVYPSLYMYTLVSVINRPLIDVITIIPTRIKDTCWDQNITWNKDVHDDTWNGKKEKERKKERK